MSRFGTNHGFSLINTHEAISGPKVQLYVSPGCYLGRNAPKADRAEGPALNVGSPTFRLRKYEFVSTLRHLVCRARGVNFFNGLPMSLNSFFSSVSFVAMFACVAPAFGQLTFNFVDSSGAPAVGNPNLDPVAVAGFVEAGERWSAIFDDDITVNIEINFAPIPSVTGATILGATGTSLVDSPADLAGTFPTFELLKDQLAVDATSANDFIAVENLPVGNAATNGPGLAVMSFLTNDRDGNIVLDDDTSLGGGDLSAINNALFAITTANAKAIGLLSPTDPGIDATITFNSDVSFDFDPSNGVPFGSTDFVGVATHEVGHALGFISGADVVDTFTGVGPSAGADLNGFGFGIGELDAFALFSTFDLFRRSSAAFALDPDALDLSTGAPGSSVFFSIDADVIDGDDILLETGSFNGTGNQASHFNDEIPSLGILDPTVASGEVLTISENDILVFDVIGYDLVDSVASVLGDFDGDSDVDLADLDQYIGNIGAPAEGVLAELDLDGSGTIEAADFQQHFSALVETSNGLTGTFAGDTNLDGEVDVLEDAFTVIGNLGIVASSWSQGDTNADGAVTVLGDAFILISNMGSNNAIDTP